MKKEKKNGRIGIVIGFLVILAIVVLLFVKAYDRSRLTYYKFEKEGLAITSIDFRSFRGVRLYIPNDISLETSKGKGMFKVGDLEKLSEQMDKGWTEESITLNTGIYINSKWDEKTNMDLIYYNIFRPFVIWRRIDIDRYLEEKEEIDGYTRKNIDWSKFSLDAKLWFADRRILSENLSVVVVNSSGTNGLATMGSKILLTSGVSVVNVETETKDLKKCLLEVGEEHKSSYTVEYIKNLIGCDVSVGNVNDRIAKIRIYLSLEESKRWTGQSSSSEG